MHYRIKLIGEYETPRKPWLNVTMSGHSFESETYAHKFHDITEAKGWLDRLKLCGQKVFMTWHDESEDANDFYGSWGEVSRGYLAKLD
jgi:hypothetical protein